MNLAVLFVVGYFILELSGKMKNSQSGDNLPRYTTQRSKAEIEQESREIIKRESSRDAPSNERIRSAGRYGLLDIYLLYTKNDETLTTTANSDSVQTLSENGLLWDSKLFWFIFVVLFQT